MKKNNKISDFFHKNKKSYTKLKSLSLIKSNEWILYLKH